MTNLPIIILKKDKEKSILRRHPWLFSGAIASNLDTLSDGAIVEILDYQKKYLATAYHQKGASIVFKMISFVQTTIDKDFWKKKVLEAFDLRKKLAVIRQKKQGFTENSIFRLINGESDGFPGLIVDYYAGVLVLQSYSLAMHQLKSLLSTIFQEIFADELLAIYDKSASTSFSKQELSATATDNQIVVNDYLYKNPNKNLDYLALENGIPFYIDWEKGQKTGFFIDQRDNRQHLANYAKDKNVLNTFCYSGGFSIYALLAGAKSVTSVDSSAQALNMLAKNLEINQFINTTRHKSVQMDVSDYLKIENTAAENFDIIVLDPPAFAKKISAKHKALHAYKQLNIAAIKKINSGGLLFTFSCSQAMDTALFEDTIRAAAIEAKREIKILQHLSRPIDHAVDIFYPEGEYLKGLILWIK